MGYKPADFYIGVIDFFGVLVPGAVLLFLYRERLPGALALGLKGEQTVIVWAAFLVGSYVLGHFLLGIGVPLNKLLRFFKSEAKDKFYNEVKDAIKLPPGMRKKRSDAFHRAYSFLQLNNPSAVAEIERQMADYKLFRGLTLVFLLDALLGPLRNAGVGARSISVLLFVIAGWRFLFLLHWTHRITFESYALLRGSSDSGEALGQTTGR